jgi:glycosyltransferase involved in cell wall biosynthesis
MAALESIACGTPAIAAPVGALPELLPQNSGLVLTDKVAEIVEAVRRPPPPTELSQGRRQIAQSYGLERHGARLAELLATTRKSRARYVPRGVETRATL